MYVDLYFMINFSMDFLCLFITAKLMGIRASLLRQVLAAGIGGAYAVAALFLPLGTWGAIFADVSACLAIVAAAFFSRREPLRIIVYTLVFAAVSMVLGGIMTALFNLLNKTGLAKALEGGGDGISTWMFAVLAIISGGITLLSGGYFKGRMARHPVEAEITLMGKTVDVRGMGDSGNLLRDPVMGKPCIVADIDALASVIPEELYFAAKSRSAEKITALPTELQRRIILVPTKTASGDGILVGVRADKVVLVCGKGKKGYEVDAPVVLTELKEGAGENKILVPSELLA